MTQKKENITILINQKPYHVEKSEMTGAEIRELGEGPPDYWVTLVVKDPDEFAGGDDPRIMDDQRVELKSGMRFRIVNPGTYG